jgi:hypothetical protein
MIMRSLRKSFITSLLCLAPILANASSCEDITEQIKHDTAKYGDTITNQHLPWMCLSWLQQQMGKHVLKNVIDNMISYTWECSRDSDSKLTIQTDKDGKLTHVEGQYSSERGAGVFAAAVNASCESPKTSITTLASVAVVPPPQTPTDDTKPNTAACDATAEQIYDVASISQDHPYTHSPYAWEDKDWLEKTYGKPEARVVATNTFYTWHCENDAMTTIAYSEIQPGHHIQLTTLCKGSTCYLATVSRDKDVIKGSLKPIEPKPT